MPHVKLPDFRMVLALALIAFAVVASAGCSGGGGTVEVTPAMPKNAENAVGEDGMTPVERGKLREEILGDLREDLDVWRRGDIDSLPKAFVKQQVDNRRKAEESDRAAGKVFVRVHDDPDIEVTDIASDKKSAHLIYTFTDKSYYAEAGSGRMLTQPANKKTQVTIKAVKQEGRWKIELTIGSSTGVR